MNIISTDLNGFIARNINLSIIIKIEDKLGFKMSHTVEGAIQELVEAFDNKKYKDPLANEDYFNIKKMQNISLK